MSSDSWPTEIDALLTELENTKFVDRVEAQTALVSVAAALTAAVSNPVGVRLFAAADPPALTSPFDSGDSPQVLMYSLHWPFGGKKSGTEAAEYDLKWVRERVTRMMALGDRIADELHAKQLQVTVGFPFVLTIGLVWERDKTK